MLKIEDPKLLLECVAEAISQAHQTESSKLTRNRWVRAIAKAAAELMEGETDFIHFEPEKKILYFWSHDSGEIYETDETCACPAFAQKRKQPCYHRAMRKLLINYFHFLERPGTRPTIDFADAVFFDTELSIREKIDLLNISFQEGQVEVKPRIEELENFLPR